MKSVLYTISIAVFVLAFQSCMFNTVKGSGAVVSNEIDISDYKGIDFVGKGTMVYEQKPGKPYLRIETDDNIYALLEIGVKDGILRINSEENINPTKFTIYANSSALEHLSISGSMKATLKGKLETSSLDIDIAGSGNITAEDLVCRTLRTDIAGSGNFLVAGKAEKMECSIAGSGKVVATDMEADEVSCSISGSGDFFVTANKRLNVDISGSGSVKYRGNPQIEQSVAGSGKVSEMD